MVIYPIRIDETFSQASSIPFPPSFAASLLATRRRPRPPSVPVGRRALHVSGYPLSTVAHVGSSVFPASLRFTSAACLHRHHVNGLTGSTREHFHIQHLTSPARVCARAPRVLCPTHCFFLPREQGVGSAGFVFGASRRRRHPDAKCSARQDRAIASSSWCAVVWCGVQQPGEELARLSSPFTCSLSLLTPRRLGLTHINAGNINCLMGGEHSLGWPCVRCAGFSEAGQEGAKEMHTSTNMYQ